MGPQIWESCHPGRKSFPINSIWNKNSRNMPRLFCNPKFFSSCHRVSAYTAFFWIKFTIFILSSSLMFLFLHLFQYYTFLPISNSRALSASFSAPKLPGLPKFTASMSNISTNALTKMQHFPFSMPKMAFVWQLLFCINNCTLFRWFKPENPCDLWERWEKMRSTYYHLLGESESEMPLPAW